MIHTPMSYDYNFSRLNRVYVAFVLNTWRQYRLRDELPLILPPGPIGLPLVGNVFDLDTSQPCLSYERWARSLSRPFLLADGLVYANLLGKDFKLIIINST